MKLSHVTCWTVASVNYNLSKVYWRNCFDVLIYLFNPFSDQIGFIFSWYLNIKDNSMGTQGWCFQCNTFWYGSCLQCYHVQSGSIWYDSSQITKGKMLRPATHRFYQYVQKKTENKCWKLSKRALNITQTTIETRHLDTLKRYVHTTKKYFLI